LYGIVTWTGEMQGKLQGHSLCDTEWMLLQCGILGCWHCSNSNH